MSTHALEADLLLEESQETGSARGAPPVLPPPPPRGRGRRNRKRKRQAPDSAKTLTIQVNKDGDIIIKKRWWSYTLSKTGMRLG